MVIGPKKHFKVVYILGAGCSVDAGFPMQHQLLDRVRDSYFKAPKRNFLQSSALTPHPDILEDFLEKTFASKTSPILEDIFTLLDQTIARRGHCHEYPWNTLDLIRDTLKRSILTVLHESMEKISKNRRFYEALGAFFVHKRLEATLEEDTFSVISTNWDPLLEEAIYWTIAGVDAYKKIDVDYCCYTEPLGKSCPH